MSVRLILVYMTFRIICKYERW